MLTSNVVSRWNLALRALQEEPFFFKMSINVDVSVLVFKKEGRKVIFLANFVDGTDKSALVKRARHATRNKTRAKPTKEPSTNTLLIVYSIPLRTDLSTLFTLQKRTKIILTRCYVV